MIGHTEGTRGNDVAMLARVSLKPSRLQSTLRTDIYDCDIAIRQIIR